MKLNSIILLACFSFVCTVIAADAWKLPPETAKYRPGRGIEVVSVNCVLCHSADYVATQPPLTRPAWKAIVDKMRLKYGAPISTNNVEVIVDYLSNSYGR